MKFITKHPCEIVHLLSYLESIKIDIHVEKGRCNAVSLSPATPPNNSLASSSGHWQLTEPMSSKRTLQTFAAFARKSACDAINYRKAGCCPW